MVVRVKVVLLFVDGGDTGVLGDAAILYVVDPIVIRSVACQKSPNLSPDIQVTTLDPLVTLTVPAKAWWP